ncbi:MAG: hypothetical protein H6779_04190 [Candidatus Nomurabacteria bacterium]|nr:MAG: hypothetical protein H6779_04190 [Candidatus Nomurabacteria bacterium]
MRKIFEKLKNAYNSLASKLKNKGEDSNFRGSDHLFNSGDIFTAKNDELMDALRELGIGHVPNDIVRHRQIIRALTIDSIINRRHVEALEKKNTQLAAFNIILSIAVILLTAWGLFISPQAKVAQNEVDNFQRQAQSFCENNPRGYWSMLGGGEKGCVEILEMLAE